MLNNTVSRTPSGRLLSFLLILVLWLGWIDSAHAQDSNKVHTEICGDTIPIQASKLERAEWVLGASAAFSIADYIGFGATREHPKALSVYRVVQVALQAGISYFLYQKFGLKETISFNLIWWSWCDDLGFYGIANLINPKPPFENRSWNGLQSPITWAYWTPLGLTRPRGSAIAEDALVIQAILGLSISIIIL